MVGQNIFAESEHAWKKRRTRREVFFEQQNRPVSWGRLARRVAPCYPKPGRGRRRYPLRGMQRVHCAQLFYKLSAPGVEELFYEVESVRRFSGLRLTGSLPAETKVLHLCQLLERHGPGSVLFGEVNAHVALLGHGLKTVTVVDASLVEAPSSTQNRTGGRDPEMCQAKQGNQWHFGMKAPIGAARTAA